MKKHIGSILAIVSIFVVSLICGCGGSSGTGGAAKPPGVPDGAYYTSQFIHSDRIQSVAGYGAGVIWAQAATLTETPAPNEQALVTVEYIRAIEKNLSTGDESIVMNTDYTNLNVIWWGGLWLRDPYWFPIEAKDAHTPMYNATLTPTGLAIDVAKYPLNISHWGTARFPVRNGHSYLAEIKVKIEGSTAVQLGLDYWRDMFVIFNVFDVSCATSNNCESWISNWILPTNSQFVVVRVPINF